MEDRADSRYHFGGGFVSVSDASLEIGATTTRVTLRSQQDGTNSRQQRLAGG